MKRSKMLALVVPVFMVVAYPVWLWKGTSTVDTVQEHNIGRLEAMREEQKARLESRRDLERLKNGEKLQHSRFNCEAWLEEEDPLSHFSLRDFELNPIEIVEEQQVFEWFRTLPEDIESCPVRFEMVPWAERDEHRQTDAFFFHDFSVFRQEDERRSLSKYGASVLRDQEFWASKADVRQLYDMTVGYRLDSDVPFLYASWKDFDFLRPVQEKTAERDAAAFISKCPTEEEMMQEPDCYDGSCRVTSFRMEAMKYFMREGGPLKVDSYGKCAHNVEESWGSWLPDVDLTATHKFSFAFENSQGRDYVTEKFFRALVSGSIPVVIGSPTIAKFAPSKDSYIEIRTVKDLEAAEERMVSLLANQTAYDAMLSWKNKALPDSFKALVDMMTFPHPTCRLAIALATKEWLQRMDTSPSIPTCRCVRGYRDEPHSNWTRVKDVTFHILVRERGTFYPKSVFLNSKNVTVAALHRAVEKKILGEGRSAAHEEALAASGAYVMERKRAYAVYPVQGTTQFDALFGKKVITTDDQLRRLLRRHNCPLLEVIFV